MSSSTEKKQSSSVHSSSDEKAAIVQTEDVVGPVADGHLNVEKLKHEVYNAHMDVSGVDEKKLLRKLDWWLVPWLSFLYLLSFLDRTSIGNARVSRSAAISFRTTNTYASSLRVSISCTDWRRTYISTTISTILP